MNNEVHLHLRSLMGRLRNQNPLGGVTRLGVHESTRGEVKGKYSRLVYSRLEFSRPVFYSRPILYNQPEFSRSEYIVDLCWNMIDLFCVIDGFVVGFV